MPIRGVGVGKSTLCNFLVDGKDSGKFKTSKSTKVCETRMVSSCVGKALGDKSASKEIKVFDVPGIDSKEVPVEEWIQAVKDGIRSDEYIDAVLIVINSTDYTVDLAQIAAIKAAKLFLNLDNVYLCLTHCDQHTPDIGFIRRKIASYKKYGRIHIQEENVILYDKTY